MSDSNDANLFLDLVESGQFITREKNGYLQFYEDGKWIWIHRRVAELKSGKIIPKGFEVHHINRDKTDNRPENLQILSIEEHRAIHSNDKKSSLYTSKNYINDVKDKILEKFKLNFPSTYLSHSSFLSNILSVNEISHSSTYCFRCGGRGYLPEYNYYMNGVCFSCMGRGIS